MKTDANIITIGDELLIGQVVDTNAAWIAQRLNEAGMRVYRKLTIADNRQEIESTVAQSMRQVALTVITGGLGPTKDDITKKTLCTLFGSRLVRNEQVYAQVEKMMHERGIEFNALNAAQALVPECCTVLPNKNGTAPGMWFERDGAIVVSLPGVPFEMQGIITDEVLPKLRERFSLQAVVHRTMITFGLAESMLAERIADWESSLPEVLHLAYLPSPAKMRLRLSAYGIDREQAEKLIDERFAQLEQIIPQYFVGYGEQSVQQAVAELLTTSAKSLAVAESCTGGALSAMFTAMPGASAYFRGGVVSYSNEVKMNVLGVKRETLEQFGAVSEQTVREMAEGVRRLCGSDYSIATTGIAGPDGGTPDKPVGTVWMAVAWEGGSQAQLMHYGRLRAQNIDRSATSAINLLRLKLIEE